MRTRKIRSTGGSMWCLSGCWSWVLGWGVYRGRCRTRVICFHSWGKSLAHFRNYFKTFIFHLQKSLVHIQKKIIFTGHEQMRNTKKAARSMFLSVGLFVWWCLTPLSTIFQLYRVKSILFLEETGVPEENHQPVASHWQTLSHNVVHLALIETQTHNISGDRHWLHR
jgi:hypothetical protein